MKNKSNKKVVSAVKRFVARAAQEARMLKRGSEELAKNAGDRWDATKPRREKIGAAMERAVAQAERKAEGMFGKMGQIRDDVATGFKQGMREAHKKPL